ncbi:serine/threonine-protein kinase, partial [Roseisolibacter sp. H3M3-2]|uniref:serine/threonine-protein kinase n=1 Tax=Roseisolibacter sp. H3M3-2 TaxID=3031323 RepID=UPI0023D98072
MEARVPVTKVCAVCDARYPDDLAFCARDGAALRAEGGGEELVGSVIAERYLVTRLLGEGGMGKVYLARHVRLPQQVAIKVLRADLAHDTAAVARFTREASNAAQIEQEHVARVYDFGETPDGLVYLAMEFVPGETLRHLVEREGALPPRRVAELVRQIAEGLDAAHQLPHPLIHRDLKPENVLIVTTASGRDRVKVMDFGIAKAFGVDERGLTRTGFVVGTPEFMSPEQLLGEPLDARSDVYALALVAFVCLTGQLPFESTTPERARLGRLLEPPRRLLDLAPEGAWPASLQAVLDDALSRDPAARPPTAGDFSERLSAAIGETWGLGSVSGAHVPLRTPDAVPAAVVLPAEAAAASASADVATPEPIVRAVEPARSAR